jgi:hypothetical protein
MKPRQLQFFLLEFTLSLVILSVALVVAINVFAVSARQHTQTVALRTLSQTVTQEAEWLRHPDSDWDLRYPQTSMTTAYDVNGQATDEGVYTVTVTMARTASTQTATLILRDANRVWLTLQVVKELTP